jgi:glycosyltransferase involved in cell wall biosynthesis
VLRVAALTSGPTVPSARFRVRQHVPLLRDLGIDVREHSLPFSKYASPRREQLGAVWTTAKIASRIPGVLASRRADITWIERELVPGRQTLEGLCGGVRLLDVDDAIWLSDARTDVAVQLARRADGVLAGNQHIEDHFAAIGARTWLVPTAIDTDRWRPRAAREDGQMIVGWTGSASTLPYLEAIGAPLARFVEGDPARRVLVVSDVAPRLPAIPPHHVKWYRWTPEGEVEAVQAMDIGLMPQPDEPWVRGKCSLKMLQYMAVGIPTVCSEVGHARELLARGEVGRAASTADEWEAALSELARDAELRRRLGRTARNVVETDYAATHVSRTLAAIFRSVAE